MWILIWRGWGILVIPIVAAAFFISIALTAVLRSAGLPVHWAAALSTAASSVLAGLSLWFIAKGLSGKVVRRLVDPATGKDVLFRRSAGSLFFIPTKYWAFIVPVLGLLLGADFAWDPHKTMEKALADRAPAEAPAQMDAAQSQ